MNTLWIDFLNSEWHDWRGSGRSEDRLEKTEWVSELLKNWGLSAPLQIKPKDLEALKQLRQLLQSIVRSIVKNGESELSADDLHALNKIMANGPIVPMVSFNERYQLHFVPVQHDWAQIMSTITASFAKTLTEGELTRIRICNNPDCLWIFYDDTRNRSKKYCDDKLCGNLMKVRRFRDRRKETMK